jgi:hypothetical protein
MKKRIGRHPRRGLITAAVVLVFAGALGTATTPSDARGPSGKEPGGARQGGEKLLRLSSSPDMPIQIMKVKNKKRDLPLGKKFEDDDEWLRGFTITVRNDSGRDITYLGFAVLFPADTNQAASEFSYTFDFMLWVSPQSKHYKESRRLRPERIIRPDEKYDLTLSDEQYEHIQKALSSLGYPSVRDVEIWLDEVGFDDGTSWMGGQIIHPEDCSEKNRPAPGAKSANDFFYKDLHRHEGATARAVQVRGGTAQVL